MLNTNHIMSFAKTQRLRQWQNLAILGAISLVFAILAIARIAYFPGNISAQFIALFGFIACAPSLFLLIAAIRKIAIIKAKNAKISQVSFSN